MKKRLYKIIILALATVCCAVLSSCGNDDVIPVLDESGNLYPLDKSTVSYEGEYYIKREDQFFRLNNVGVNELASNKAYYQWFTSYYDKYTPILDEKSTLVYIDSTKRPTSVPMFRLEDQGFTLGSIFETYNENGNVEVTFKKDATCSTSPIAAHINSKITKPQAVKLTKIGTKDFSRSMIDSLGFIHGMEEGANYRFGLYEGTVYKELVLKADTHLYLSSTNYSSSKFIEKQSIFYEIVLPENLPNGKYLIPDHGMFEYKIEDNVVLPIDIDDLPLSLSDFINETTPTEFSEIEEDTSLPMDTAPANTEE